MSLHEANEQAYLQRARNNGWLGKPARREHGMEIKNPEAESTYKQDAAIGGAIAEALGLTKGEASTIIGLLRTGDEQIKAQTLADLAHRLLGEVE